MLDVYEYHTIEDLDRSDSSNNRYPERRFAVESIAEMNGYSEEDFLKRKVLAENIVEMSGCGRKHILNFLSNNLDPPKPSHTDLYSHDNPYLSDIAHEDVGETFPSIPMR